MKVFIIPWILLAQQAWSQHVGIGTTTPTGPLSFSSAVGNKIVLWGNGSTSHYGMGIQAGQLQIYANTPSDNVSFGYGRSDAFTERMRIINNGADGMLLNGRLHLRNGTNPLNLDYGSGVWLYKADNSNLLGFMGTHNNQNIGFYGGPAGWGFTYDAINSRVGIGNQNPNAPLAFAPALGKKITLYPGNTGDVGFGVAGNRLQIYSDNPNADVAVGYDVAGTFIERFAFKPNGALALSGQTGSPGQVLRSNGNAATYWSSATNDLFARTAQITGNASVSISSYVLTDVPGFVYAFNVPTNARVMVHLNVFAYAGACAFCGASQIDLRLNMDGADAGLHRYILTNGEDMTMTGTVLMNVAAGNHTLKLRAAISGPAVYVGTTPSVFNNNMIVQIIPE
jgi:hypothetical protein